MAGTRYVKGYAAARRTEVDAVAAELRKLEAAKE